MEYQRLVITGSEIEIDLLNRATILLFTTSPNDPNFSQINSILSDFSNRPDSWLACFPVLESDFCHFYTKFIICEILQKYIQNQFLSLPDVDRREMGELLLNIINKMVDVGGNQTVIEKADSAFVQILKRDWEINWPNFLSDLKESCTSCQRYINALKIIQLIGEEIDNSYNTTQVDSMKMQLQLNNGYDHIYLIVKDSLQQALYDMSVDENFKKQLVEAANNALIPVIPRVDRQFLDERLILVFQQLLSNDDYCIRTFFTLSKFCEDSTQIQPLFFSNALLLFKTAIEKIHSLKGEQINFNCIQENEIFWIAYSINNFLQCIPQNDLQLDNGNHQYIALNWMIQFLNYVNNDDNLIFPVLLNFFEFECKTFYKFFKKQNVDSNPLTLKAYQNLYSPAFSIIIKPLIEKIVSPYEVISVKQVDMSSNNTILYQTFHKILVFLFHLKGDEVKQSISNAISVFSESRWTTQNIYSLSWSVGALSKVFNSEDNNQLMTILISLFLNLFNNTDQQEIKEASASSLLYLCYRQPSYFRRSPDILNSLVDQIFIFLKSNSTSLHSIALYTFRSFAESCKQTFYLPINDSNGYQKKIIDIILDSIPEFFRDAKCSKSIQKSLISSIGTIISLESETKFHSNMLLKQLIQPIETNFMVNEKLLISGDKTNEYLEQVQVAIEMFCSVSNTASDLFVPIFLEHSTEMIELFSYIYNEESKIFNEIQKNQALFNYFQILNKVANKIVKIIMIIISKISYNNKTAEELVKYSYNFLISFLYSNPFLIPSNILLLSSELIKKFSNQLGLESINQIFVNIFLHIVPFIRDEYDSYQDLRTGLLELINAIIINAPHFILSLSEDNIDIFFQALIWFSDHPYHHINLKALEIFIATFNTYSNQKLLFSEYNQNNILDKLNEKIVLAFAKQIIKLLQDPIYKNTFDLQILVLQHAFNFQSFINHSKEIIEHINNTFQRADGDQLFNFLINSKSNLLQFRQILKDFLIDAKRYSSKDPELCALERYKQKRDKFLEDQEVPGMELIVDKEQVDKEVEIMNDLLSGLDL